MNVHHHLLKEFWPQVKVLRNMAVGGQILQIFGAIQFTSFA